MVQRRSVALHRALQGLVVAAILASPTAWAQGVSASAVPAGPDLTGTWRMDLFAASLAKVPVLGDTGVMAHSVMVAEVSYEGGAWVQRHRVCAMEASSDRQLAKTVIPPTFVAAMPRKQYTWALGAGTTPTMATNLGPIAIGWDKSKSTSGTLPTSSDDPAVIDWDRDGQPGATIMLDVPLIGDVDIYVVQYNSSRLSGKLVSAGRVEGQLVVEVLEQGTIGASNRLFARSADARPDPSKSRFTLVKVADGTDCSGMPVGVTP